MCEKQVAIEDAYCLHVPKGDNPGSHRCNKCNSLQSRIYRAKGTMNWPSKEAKVEFYKQHSALTGNELKKELEITLSTVQKETTRDKDDENVEWLDETDLKTRYKDKPQQLKSILEKAETREHPTRNVTLYADIVFKTLHSHAFEVETEAKRKATSHDVVKGAKKIKQEKQEQDKQVKKERGEPPARDAKPLATGHRAKLVKMEQKLDQVKEDYKQFGKHKEDPYLASFLPSVLVEASEKNMAEVDAALAELPLVLTEGWVGNFKEMFQRTSAAAEAGQTSNQMLLEIVQMATKVQGKDKS